MLEGADWYKRYPRLFLDGAQGLGPELIGAYAVLLDLIYARGGQTLRDDAHLAGVMGCSKRAARSLTDRLIERGKIIVRGEFVTNKRAETDANTKRNISEVRASAGRTGGEKSGESRRNKRLGEANDEAKRSREEEIREDKKEDIDSAKPLSKDFAPPDDWIAEAINKGNLSRDEALVEWEEFSGYWTERASTKGGKKRNWRRTWVTFVTGDICQRRIGQRRRNLADQQRQGGANASSAGVLKWAAPQ